MKSFFWHRNERLDHSALVQVLDARDPMGTRCKQVEAYLKKEKAHKHLFFVLNKVKVQLIFPLS